MELKEKKPTSVPQFGGWDQKSPGATDYSMVFTKARANKKQQKTDLTEVKRNSLGSERELLNAAKHGHAAKHHARPCSHLNAHAHAHVKAQHAQEEPVVMKKPTSVPQFGGWDQKSPGATDYSMVFTKARANKKQQKTDLTEVKRNSLGSERELLNAAKHGHAAKHHARACSHLNAHAHAHVKAQHAQEEPVVMGKNRFLTYINCCIRP